MARRLSDLGILVALLVLTSGIASAQPCDSILSTAQAEYTRGQYVPAIDQLNTCLQSDRMTGASLPYRATPETDSRSFIEPVQTENQSLTRAPRSPYVREMTPLRFNIGLHGTMLSGNKLDRMHAGVAASFGVSYFLTPQIGIEAVSTFGALSSDYYGLQEFSLGVRHLFATSSRLSPYVGIAGVQRRTSRVEPTRLRVGGQEFDTAFFYSVNGYGGMLYGGILMALSPSLALDFQASGAVGTLTRNSSALDEPLSGTTGLVGVNLVWAPNYR